MSEIISNTTWDNSTRKLTLANFSTEGLDVRGLAYVFNITKNILVYEVDLQGQPSTVEVTDTNKFQFTFTSFDYNASWENTDKFFVSYAPPSVVGRMSDEHNTVYTSTASGMSFLKGIVRILKDTWNSSTHSFNFDFAGKLGGEDIGNDVMAGLPKPVNAAEYATLNYSYRAGAITKGVVKATDGNLYAMRFINRNAAVRYAQIHNKGTAPVAGETPLISIEIPAGTTNNPGVAYLDSGFFTPSDYCANGISWAVSTTDATFTDAATASEHAVQIRYF